VKPKAIICDLDGTLFHRGDRDPYDMTKVGEDTVDEAVANVVRAMFKVGYHIVFTSGRDESCRYATEEAIEENVIPVYDLLMRPIGDNRDDATVKKEMLDQIRELYQPILALDDRNRVVDMWRANGVPCWQVCSREEGNF